MDPLKRRGPDMESPGGVMAAGLIVGWGHDETVHSSTSIGKTEFHEYRSRAMVMIGAALIENRVPGSRTPELSSRQIPDDR